MNLVQKRFAMKRKNEDSEEDDDARCNVLLVANMGDKSMMKSEKDNKSIHNKSYCSMNPELEEQRFDSHNKTLMVMNRSQNLI